MEKTDHLDSVGQLALGIAHDFNHDLGIIKNYTLFILRTTEKEQIKKDAQVVLDAAERAAGLARSLMRFAQAEEPDPTIFSLNDSVRQATSLLESFPAVTLEVDLADDLRPIKADRQQIEQVIINLALNAQDAMGRTGGTIRISTKNVVCRVGDDCDDIGFFACLSVEDDGPGIPKEVVPRIFEPFFTTKDRDAGHGGSGLGLAIVYGVVQRANGAVTVESRPGKTVFTIKLPAGQPAMFRLG